MRATRVRALQPADAARAPRPAAFVVMLCASITLTTVYNGGIPLLPPRSLSAALIAFLPLAGIVMSYQLVASRKVRAIGISIAALFFVVTALTVALNGDAGESTLVLLAPGITAVAISFAGGLLTAAEFQQVARWVIIIAAAQLLMAIAEVQFQMPWATRLASTDGVYRYQTNLIVEGMYRASGTMGHPILFGLLCTVGVLLLLNPLIVPFRLLRLVLILGFSYGVLLSGSRSCLAALGVTILIYFLHPRAHVRRGLRTILILTLIPLLLIYVSEAISEARAVSLFSLTNRLDALPRFIETFERPFIYVLLGDGRTFGLETVADNQFLTTSGEYGLLGLIVVLAGVAVAIFSPRPLVTAGMALIAFMSLSFDTLQWSFTACLFWLFIAMAQGDHEQPTPDPAAPRSRGAHKYGSDVVGTAARVGDI